MSDRGRGKEVESHDHFRDPDDVRVVLTYDLLRSAARTIVGRTFHEGIFSLVVLGFVFCVCFFWVVVEWEGGWVRDEGYI